MRPRVVSYGETSTLTRSPTHNLILFMRNFPDNVAKITCVPESTLKKVPGSASSTTPSITIRSSLSVDDPRCELRFFFWFFILNCFFFASESDHIRISSAPPTNTPAADESRATFNCTSYFLAHDTLEFT